MCCYRVSVHERILIAGSSKLLEREKMRFDISTFTSRRNPHVEIDQSLPHPAIRRSVLLSGKCTRTNSYCWVQQTARKREMRFDISTFTSTRNPHIEIDQSNLIFSLSSSLLDPAIRIRSCTLYPIPLLRVWQWLINFYMWVSCRGECADVKSHFSLSSSLLDPAIRIRSCTLTR